MEILSCNVHPRVGGNLVPKLHQLFIACNAEKRGEPGIFLHVNMV